MEREDQLTAGVRAAVGGLDDPRWFLGQHPVVHAVSVFGASLLAEIDVVVVVGHVALGEVLFRQRRSIADAVARGEDVVVLVGREVDDAVVLNGADGPVRRREQVERGGIRDTAGPETHVQIVPVDVRGACDLRQVWILARYGGRGNDAGIALPQVRIADRVGVPRDWRVAPLVVHFQGLAQGQAALHQTVSGAVVDLVARGTDLTREIADRLRR